MTSFRLDSFRLDSKKNMIMASAAAGLFIIAGLVLFFSLRGGSEGPSPVDRPEVQEIISSLAEQQIPDEEMDYDEEFEILPLDKVEPGAGRRAAGGAEPTEESFGPG
jgi:hypothetical protein